MLVEFNSPIIEEQAGLTRKNEAGSQVEHPVYPCRQGRPSQKNARHVIRIKKNVAE